MEAYRPRSTGGGPSRIIDGVKRPRMRLGPVVARAGLALAPLIVIVASCSGGKSPTPTSTATTATGIASLSSTASPTEPPPSPTGEAPTPLLGGQLVTFASDGPFPVEVTGELVTPPGEGPFPAVLFISGSGSQRRDGYQPPFNLGYDEIVHALVEAGFATLVFDDRGTGGTPIGVDDPTVLGYDAILGDARGAYHALLARPEVDPHRVVLFGHSEGGVTALILAGEQAPAGVILMSSPGRPLVEVSVDQVLALMPATATAEQRSIAAMQQRAILQAMIDNRIDDFSATEEQRAVMRAQAAYLRELAPYDPARLLANLDVPALVFQGDKDFQVLPDKDGAALAAAIEGRPGSEYHLLHDADHLLWQEPLESSLNRYLQHRPPHPDFLPTVTRWLTNLLAP
jgi:pimeloyl-ACP methyl ester carboxylesterase